MGHVCPKVHDIAYGTQLIHHVPPATQGSNGEPVCQSLGEDRQVWNDLEEALSSSDGMPEPCDHLVEHQQAVVLLGDLSQKIQEAVLRFDASDRRVHHGLREYCGNLSLVLPKDTR